MKNVLLLRGLVRHHRHWWDFPEILKAIDPSIQLFTLDFPGVGTEHARPSPWSISEIRKDVARRFHEQIHSGDWPKTNWSILAISLGGMVAMDWLAAEPALFSHGILVNSSAQDSGKMTERFNVHLLPKILLEVFNFRPYSSEKIILESTVNLKLEKLAERLTLLVSWRAEFPLKMKTFGAQLLAGRNFRTPPRISANLLIITSYADRLVSHHCSEYIAQKYQAPIRFHQTAGHDLSLDDPEWLADQVSDFLET